MHPGPGRDGGGGVADGKAVFDGVLPRRDGPHGQLVALGDVPGRNDGQAQIRQSDRRAFGDGLQRHGDVIRRVDVDGERHKQWLLYHMISNNNRAARLACLPPGCVL